MAELSLSLPVKGEEAPGADAKVNAAFTEIQTQFNGKVAEVNLEAGSVTGAKTKADLSGLRLIDAVPGAKGSSAAANTFFFLPRNVESQGLEGGLLKATTPVWFVALNPTDFAISGKTTKAVLAASLVTNAVAPNSSFTFGLFPIESVKGGAATLEFKFSAVVAGSEVKITTPAKETLSNGKATFTFPAEGQYAIGVTTSAETAANSFTLFSARLYAKNE